MNIRTTTALVWWMCSYDYKLGRCSSTVTPVERCHLTFQHRKQPHTHTHLQKKEKNKKRRNTMVPGRWVTNESRVRQNDHRLWPGEVKWSEPEERTDGRTPFLFFTSFHPLRGTRWQDTEEETVAIYFPFHSPPDRKKIGPLSFVQILLPSHCCEGNTVPMTKKSPVNARMWNFLRVVYQII